jgi:hypothetical protein
MERDTLAAPSCAGAKERNLGTNLRLPPEAIVEWRQVRLAVSASGKKSRRRPDIQYSAAILERR